jgi:hypothetical protein
VETKQAPYAPPSAVLKVIRHYADRDVPERVSLINLIQIGVTEALAPRTYVALKFLGLLEDDGTTTDRFKALRYAKTDEYQEVFGGVLDAAYKDIIDHVDIGSATDTDIANAFRPYSPGGQRSRMITLFVALAREAGWSLDNVGPTTTVAAKPKTRAARPAKPIAKKQAAREDEPKIDPPPTTGWRFGVTDADLAALPDGEFDAVWTALGKIAKARAQSLKAAQDMADAARKRMSEDADGGQ